MKKILFIFSCLLCYQIQAQHTINGVIKDEGGNPIEGANIYLGGTIDGSTSNTAGEFTFATTATGKVTLIANFMGYQDYIKVAPVEELQNLVISLKVSDVGLDEIVISASSFSLGKSTTVEQMNSLDIVMTGGSNGDIYGAIQSLPGTQRVGEDGRLYIRGGEDRETQTFIDGMHVLVPYTNPAQNTPARSKFSPFLFKGVNFSLGGYESEYGQALSSVLPMETKDVTPSTKFGVNISPLNWGGGGTYSFGKQSISGNVTYTNLGSYNAAIPDKYDWEREYSNLALETQFKSEIGKSGIYKLYVGYDNTGFIRNIEDQLNNTPTRTFDLKQNNYYINSTYATKTKSKYDIFFGSAYSQVKNSYGSSLTPDDLYEEELSELHLKTKVKKSFSSIYKLNTGVESYIRTYDNQYTDPTQTVLQDQGVTNNIYAGYLDNQFKVVQGLYANVSGRVEYTTYNDEWTFSPRASLNYLYEDFQISGIVGKYYQTPENRIIDGNPVTLNQESATHYILGSSYSFKGKLLRVEAYHKDYDNLSLLEDGVYTSNGFGESSGLDVYFTDDSSVKNLEYTLSYSYNDSRRLYKNYPVLTTPLFSTDHNATLSVKYFIPKAKAFFGMSNTFASGRPYTDPNEGGFANNRTTSFHSLDMNLTFLLTKKVILYTSLSNVLGRENVFGYAYANTPDANNFYQSQPITASRDSFFFVGLFISLKNNSAYDVSNF